MADLIHFETTTTDENGTIEIENDDDEDEVSDVDSFIDDNEKDNGVSFYRQFENVDKSIDETVKEEYENSLVEIENFNDFSNFCESSEEELGEVDEFKDSDKMLEKLESTLFPKSEEKYNSFPNLILYALQFNITHKIDACTDDEFKDVIETLFDKIDREKFDLDLDNQKFNQQCLDINQILVKEGYFLRVYELKNKFREVRLKNSKEQKIVRQLSSCIQEKFDGFNIVCVEYSKKLRKTFKPINVVYKPVRKPEKKISCYATFNISKVYRSSCGQGDKLSHGFAYECYYCGKFFARADKHKRHVDNCSGINGIVYNFNNQNLVTFEDSLKYKGDLPMVIYFDYETTAPTDNCLDPEQIEMFVVSYVMIVAFHPDLKLNRIIVERSFAHCFQKLTTIDYLTDDQMTFVDIKVVKQLKDAAEHVSKRNCKKSLAQMFYAELFLIKQTLLAWFNSRIKSQHLQLDI